MSNSIVTKLRAMRFDRVGAGPIGRSLSTLVLVLSLCCVLAAFVVRAHNQRVTTIAAVVEYWPTVAAVEPLSASAAAQSKTPPKRIETELIICQKDGFELREIKRSKGPVFLLVKNQTQIEELTLNLARENGATIQELTMRPGKLRWSGVFDLPPGRYKLTAAQHSSWACYITIAPQ